MRGGTWASMSGASSPSPSRRDHDLRRLRGAAWAVAAGAGVLAAGLSVAAAHAFKGHDGTTRSSALGRAPRAARVRVPPAQHVPAIAGDPLPLQAPAEPPAAAPPQPTPEAETSGGS
jgi:hypothetical protein